MKHFSLFVVICAWSLAACTTEQADKPDLGYHFFPLQVGKYWEYTVDSIVYTRAGRQVDSTRLFFREVIVSQDVEKPGDTICIAERFERYDTTSPWQIREVFRLGRNATQAIRAENNLRFIKLIFPPRRNRTWNGNLYFDINMGVSVAGEAMKVFQNWEYRYLQATKDSLVVRLADFTPKTDGYRRAQEVYQPNIGLTYRRWEVLDTQCETCCGGSNALCDSLSWRHKAERGFIVIQRLTRHN